MDRFPERHFSWFPPYRLYRRYRNRRKNTARYREWLKNGKPVPPPHIVKQLAVREYAERFRLGCLVETGTYLGEMIEAVRGMFDRIYSIELDAALYDGARKKFRRYRQITLLHGDSGTVLKDVLAELDRPALFWLDGHYSGGETARGELETPVMKELENIYRHPHARNHVILIDDARCFDNERDYPGIATIEASAKAAGYDRVEVKDDIIRLSRTR